MEGGVGGCQQVAAPHILSLQQPATDLLRNTFFVSVQAIV